MPSSLDRMPLRPLGSVVLTGALLLGAAACGGDDEPAADKSPSASASASPSATATSGARVPNPLDPTGVPVSGVPTDFPTETVPLVKGAVEQPLGPGGGPEGKKGWILELKLTSTDPEKCYTDAAALLTARGFVEQPGAFDDGKGNRQAQYIGPGYAVIISSSPLDGGGCRLGYEVGQVRGTPPG